jgi:hypothetical protein
MHHHLAAILGYRSAERRPKGKDHSKPAGKEERPKALPDAESARDKPDAKR